MTTSPILASRLPPQQRQVVGGGTTTRSRGRCSGSGRRAGLAAGHARRRPCRVRLARSAAASSSAAVSSSSASWSSSWSMSRLPRSLVCPNCSRRALASSSFRRSISSLAADTRASALRARLRPRACIALGQDHRVRRGEIGGQGCGLVPHVLDASTSPAILEVECHVLSNNEVISQPLGSPGPLWHSPVNPFEQIAELTGRDRHHTIGRRRPDEAAMLQSLGRTGTCPGRHSRES